MQYAFVDGIKAEPKKGLLGICIGCGNQMVAKCGSVNLHHWAHHVNVRCDSWWESETEWHRQWKNYFDEEEREQTFYDDQLKEHHRADVHTLKGITIEFQNSPLSLEELFSREAFYPKLVWVVNGLKFKGFNITEAIPNPCDVELKGYELTGSSHLSLHRIDELTADVRKEKISIRHPELRHIKVSQKHFTFAWKHAHVAWYNSKSPVFIDNGGHFLYWLKLRRQVSGNFYYLQMVSKKDFLRKYRGW